MIAKVSVLLAAYNGEKFIEQQIQSILKQTHKPYKIFINIDRSSDNTVKIIQRYSKIFNEIQVLNTHKKFGSSAANFINLLMNGDFKDSDFVALSDQDDIWNQDKVERAINKLVQGYDGYSSNVEAFWDDGKKRVLVKNQPQQNFDYLFESPGPGCTFVLSKKLAIALREFLKINKTEINQMKHYHDWLFYAYARTNHFKWFIDGNVTMQYRQHALNDFGAHIGFSGFLGRVKKVLIGEGFDQVLLLVKMLKLENDPFVNQWYPLSRIGFLRLALYAPQCRRRFREKIYFFFACILLAIFFPKNFHYI